MSSSECKGIVGLLLRVGDEQLRCWCVPCRLLVSRCASMKDDELGASRRFLTGRRSRCYVLLLSYKVAETQSRA